MEENKKDRKRRNKNPAWRKKRKLSKDVVDTTATFSVELITEVVAVYYENVGGEWLIGIDVKWSGGDNVKKVLVEAPSVVPMMLNLMQRRIPFGVPEYGPGVSAPDPDDTSEDWKKS